MSVCPELNNFYLKIVPSKGRSAEHYISDTSKDAWYVNMPCDNCTYSLQLRNNNPDPCDANVEIDGSSVGNFRINEFDTLNLERPSHSKKQFTFFVGGSEGSSKAGYQKGERTNGLVKVTFKPGKERLPKPIIKGCASNGMRENCEPMMFARSISTGGVKEGMTGLSGNSSQKFSEIPNLNYDPSAETTIMMRLVYRDEDIEPLHKPMTTSYPEPVF